MVCCSKAFIFLFDIAFKCRLLLNGPYRYVGQDIFKHSLKISHSFSRSIREPPLQEVVSIGGSPNDCRVASGIFFYSNLAYRNPQNNFKNLWTCPLCLHLYHENLFSGRTSSPQSGDRNYSDGKNGSSPGLQFSSPVPEGKEGNPHLVYLHLFLMKLKKTNFD
jgi:hypothetical protein